MEHHYDYNYYLIQLGRYKHSIDINTLLNSGKTSGPNFEKTQMINKILIVESKQPKNAKFKTSIVKRLTNKKNLITKIIF